MFDQGIIAPVSSNESDLINKLVTREKPDGRLHTCLDHKDLKTVIKRENHPVTTGDDITPILCRATELEFTKLNPTQGYVNAPLSKESQALTIFNIHK